MFVGRRRELAELVAALDDLGAGRGGLVLVAGEPGIGKTRLVTEASDVAARRGTTVRWGRCPDGTGAPPYWPWTQVFGELPWGDAEPDDPTARFRMFEAAAAHLRSLAPAVVVLDDLQWADPGSLKLLEHVAPSTSAAGLLVVGTYRDAEVRVGHPLGSILGGLTRVAGARRLDLVGLDDDEVAALAVATHGGHVPPATAAMIARRSEGNPFFAGELVRLLHDDGSLPDDRRPPSGVRDAVRRRVADLGSDAAEILAVAAVVGREFDVAVVAKVHGGDVEGVLADATSATLVDEHPERYGSWRFVHDLVREALYDELGTTRRVRLHAEVARAIEALHDGDDAWVAALAHHWLLAAPAGHAAEAFEATAAAGAAAFARHAAEDAARWYVAATELLDAAGVDDPERRYDVLFATGRATLAVADYAVSKAALVAAAEVARDHLDLERFAEALLAIGGERLRERGYLNPPGALLHEALGRLGDRRPDLRARLRSRAADDPDLSPAVSEAEAAAAVGLARSSGDAWAAFVCLARHVFGFPYSTALGPRDDLVAELEAWAARSGHRGVVLDARGLRFRRLLEIGDVGQAERLMPELLQWEREAGLPALVGFRTSGPLFPLVRGAFDEAERTVEALFQLATTDEARQSALDFYLLVIGVLRWLQGRGEELVPAVEALVADAPALQGELARAALALFHAEGGRRDDAARVIASVPLGLDDLCALPFGTGVAAAAMLLEAAALIDNRATVERLASHLAPIAGLSVVVGMPPLVSLGPGDVVLGIAASVLGHAEEAEARFAAALDLAERMGAPPFVARTQLCWATHLAGQGDAVGASARASQALRIARPLGMRIIAERAGTLVSAVAPSAVTPTAVVETGTVTFLFTDIESSTEQTAAMGDRAWAAALREHNAVVRGLLTEHGGREVKTLGDGFLLVFPSARRGLDCALAIRTAMAYGPLRVRVGVHTGEAEQEGDDYIGHHVNVARRVCEAAVAGEVLVSAVVREITGAAGDLRFEAGRVVEAKGLGPVTVHRVGDDPRVRAV